MTTLSRRLVYTSWVYTPAGRRLANQAAATNMQKQASKIELSSAKNMWSKEDSGYYNIPVVGI